MARGVVWGFPGALDVHCKVMFGEERPTFLSRVILHRANNGNPDLNMSEKTAFPLQPGGLCFNSRLAPLQPYLSSARANRHIKALLQLKGITADDSRDLLLVAAPDQQSMCQAAFALEVQPFTRRRLRLSGPGSHDGSALDLMDSILPLLALYEGVSFTPTFFCTTIRLQYTNSPYLAGANFSGLTKGADQQIRSC